MSERLADVSARIDNVQQLDAVVTAMRGIAAARAQQSRGLLAGIEAYAQSISDGIGLALDLLDSPPSFVADAADRNALVLFCAEQGFAGAFTDRVLEAAGAEAKTAHLIVVGSRGSAIAAERGFLCRWTTSMATQIGAVSAVANRVADALYSGIVGGVFSRACVIFPRLDSDHRILIERVALFPLDIERFRGRARAIPPITTLEPAMLIERLVAEYIFARLSEAAMQAFAAENQARVDAMSSASSNIDRALAELKQRQNQVRQEEVTAEIVELATGAASRFDPDLARP